MRARTAGASRALALLALVLLLGSAAIVRASMAEPKGGEQVAEPAGSRAQAQFAARAAQRRRISGHVTGLYPGATGRFKVEIHNPGRMPVLVRTLTAEVGAPGAGCAGGHLRIGAERLRLAIPPRASATARMTAAMAPRAPDGCQFARFPLRFAATATAAP